MTSNYFTYLHIHTLFQEANFSQEKTIISNTQKCYSIRICLSVSLSTSMHSSVSAQHLFRKEILTKEGRDKGNRTTRDVKQVESLK